MGNILFDLYYALIDIFNIFFLFVCEEKQRKGIVLYLLIMTSLYNKSKYIFKILILYFCVFY
jgi:hypothetical protein